MILDEEAPEDLCDERGWALDLFGSADEAHGRAAAADGFGDSAASYRTGAQFDGTIATAARRNVSLIADLLWGEARNHR